MHSPCVHNPQYCLGAYVRRRCIRDNGPPCTASPPRPADGKKAACIPQEVGEKAVCLHELPFQKEPADGRIPAPRHNSGFGIIGQLRPGGQLHLQPEEFPHPLQEIRIVSGRRQYRTARSSIPYRQQSHVLRHTAGGSRGYVVRFVIGKRKV